MYSEICAPFVHKVHAPSSLKQYLIEPHHIPIIALTAASFEDKLDKMRSAGINDYVAKPIDREKLISAIVSNLRKQPVD